jgi:glycerol-3-phosphate acyltransferase PlsY
MTSPARPPDPDLAPATAEVEPADARDVDAAPSGRGRQAAVVAVSYLAGSVPFAYLSARILRRVDLRSVGDGTVSGTGLYRVAGFVPLAAAGCLEVAKGSVGPALAGGRGRPADAAGGAAVVGHNWSVFLHGAGGRGLSPAIGTLLVRAPEGAGVLLGGMAVGRALRRTGFGSFLALLSLPVVLGRTRGPEGRRTALCLVAPILAKRLAGNRGHRGRGWRSWLNRLVFDADVATPVG